MKKMFKLSAVYATAASCAVTALFFTGCGEKPSDNVTIESLFDATEKKYKESNVVESNYEIDLNMKLSESDLDADFKINGDYKLSTDYDSGVMYMDGTINEEMLGITAYLSQQIYCTGDDTGYTVYGRTKNSSAFINDADMDWSDWMYSRIESTEGIESVLMSADMYDQLNELSDNLSLQRDTVKIDGHECYLVNGTLSGEKLKDITGEDTGDKELDNIDVKMKFYFDKSTRVLYRVEADLSDIMNFIIENEFASGELLGEGMSFVVNDSKLTITNTAFSKKKTVTVPEDIKKNAIEDNEITTVFSGLF